jgi:hypothetical protein
MIAVEMADGHDFGCVCPDCAVGPVTYPRP